ncbi:Oxidoreductase-like domain-containing protein 1 [Holothuria leucospilota]|uniref:Oxidoreductase-like domain-containing protein 1 n=1 Tax=Holothuria leucospilota TaxID=206669 RepID=A0A9Q1H6H4_HOLLE|nr:Oxidoreductase-like domain-containing protein 1 [Holothuria leucospilota]
MSTAYRKKIWVKMFCQALRCCRVPLRCIQNTSIHGEALYSFKSDLHHRNSVKLKSEPTNSSSYSTQASEKLPSNGQLSDKEPESAILRSEPEKCNESDRTSVQPNSKTSKKRPIPPDPDTCCESGCVNCVWIEYANEVRRFYPPEQRQKILKEILDNVEDFNVKMFLKMELGL